MSKTLRLRRTFLVALPLALLLLAACGGGGSGGDSDVASIDDSDQAAAASDAGDDGDADEEMTPEEAEAAFKEHAECMREHGVDMPDPEFVGEGELGAGGVITRTAPGEGGEAFDKEEFDKANEACAHLLDGVVLNGPGDLDPEEEAEMRDNALSFAKCMREHGIDVPDPQFGDGGMVQQELPDIDFDSDEFEEANEACADELGMEEGGPGFRMSGPEAE
jgi:hypothetical protein